MACVTDEETEAHSGGVTGLQPTELDSKSTRIHTQSLPFLYDAGLEGPRSYYLPYVIDGLREKHTHT